MKIGVMSDTHDNLSNTTTVLSTYRDQKIDTIVHCGDLTSPDMVSHFQGFRVIFTSGNMDHTTGTIKKRLEKMREDNFAGMVFKGKLGGVPIAATHSHVDGKLMELVREGRFKWIFHGHTHEKRDEMVQGVRIVNPGALGGLGREPRTFCIVDLDAEEVEFLRA
ncbi:MAG: metallophosphoesterase family protein [Brevefilum sp.]